jgi:hypothetical protein
MIRDNEIRQKANAYLRNELALDDFEDWLVSASWNMHKDSSRTAIDLASEIDSALMAYSSSSQMTEDDFRARLSSALRTAAMTPVSMDDAAIFMPPKTTGSARWVFSKPLAAVA